MNCKRLKLFLIKYHLINYDKYEESLLIREFKVYKSFIYFKLGEVTAKIKLCMIVHHLSSLSLSIAMRFFIECTNIDSIFMSPH